MKKSVQLPLMSIFIFIIFSIFSVSAYAEDTTTSGKSLIANYSFETDNFQGWSSMGNKSVIFLDNTKAHTGGTCISTKSRSADWSGPALNITDMIKAGTELSVQVYVSSEETEDVEVILSMKTIDENGTEIYTDIASETTSNGDWVLLEGLYNIPEDTVELTIYFQTPGVMTNFSIDDLTISGVREEHTESNEDNDGSKYNFDFENNLNGWIPRGDVSVFRTSEYSYSGDYSIYVSGRKEYWNGSMVRLKNISAGVDYNYSACVMYNGENIGNNQEFSIMAQYTLNGKEVYCEINRKKLQKNTWSKLSGDFVIPYGAEDIFFYVQTIEASDTDINALASFYVDNVLIFDNTIEARRKMIKKIVFIVLVFAGAAAVLLCAFMIYRKIRSTQALLLAASMDAMTKTFNRNTYEEHLDILEASPEKCKKVYLTVCDVNFLKYINDNYGHEAGDRAIIRCAEVLLKTVGKKGKVYRTGGDEFMCITKSDLTSSIKKEFSIEASRYKGYPFAVAVGTAHYDSDIDFDTPDVKTILKRSDKEMYKHKQEIKKFTQDFARGEFIVDRK